MGGSALPTIKNLPTKTKHLTAKWMHTTYKLILLVVKTTYLEGRHLVNDVEVLQIGPGDLVLGRGRCSSVLHSKEVVEKLIARFL